MTATAQEAVKVALSWCPLCKTHHGVTISPCYAADECPDCEAPDGASCHWWCPRFADVLYEWGD